MGKSLALPIENITASCNEVCRIQKPVEFNDEHLVKIAKKFEGVSNPIRLKIVMLAKEYKEITTCEIERALGLSQSKASYHIQNLVDKDILQRKTYGPWSFYSLKDSSDVLRIFQLVK